MTRIKHSKREDMGRGLLSIDATLQKSECHSYDVFFAARHCVSINVYSQAYWTGLDRQIVGNEFNKSHKIYTEPSGCSFGSVYWSEIVVQVTCDCFEFTSRGRIVALMKGHCISRLTLTKRSWGLFSVSRKWISIWMSSLSRQNEFGRKRWKKLWTEVFFFFSCLTIENCLRISIKHPVHLLIPIGSS